MLTLVLAFFLDIDLRTFCSFGFLETARWMLVIKSGKRRQLYLPHSIKSVEVVNGRPVENKGCNVSICKLWTHGVDDGDRDRFEVIVFFRLRDVFSVATCIVDAVYTTGLLLYQSLARVTEENATVRI
jgi:hypothetical protein